MVKRLQMHCRPTICMGLLLLAGILTSCTDSGSEERDVFIPPEGFPHADGAAQVELVNSSFFVPEEEPLQAFVSLPALATVSEPDETAATGIDGVYVTRESENGTVSLDSQTGAFTYTPAQDFFGLDEFRYYLVEDGKGSEQATVSISVENINDPPQLEFDFLRVAEQGSLYSLALNGTDADREPLQYFSENLPTWLTLNRNTGLLRGQPEQGDVGIYRNISFRVSDAAGAEAHAGPFAVEVLDINDSPTVNSAQFPATVDAGDRIEVNLFPDDPDGDFVTLQTEPNDFVSIEVNGGSLVLTANEVSEVTDINLVVIARDLLGSSSREIIPITIWPLTSSGRGRTLLGRREGWGIHMVVLGDGYKVDERNTFNSDVEDLIGLMKQDPSINTHMNAWNIHSVMEASNDSGIDDDFTRDVRQTAFDSGYYCQGLQRLICANTAKVFGAALDEYPYLDQIVLLINDSRYGGSGGSIAIASSAAPEIAIHELGHSIAGLADEYVDALVPNVLITAYVEGRFANVSAVNDPALVPWSHWIDDESEAASENGLPKVGIFEGAFYQDIGFYRPTSNSRMRDNLSLFGPINGEQWALSVYQRAQPVLDFSPRERSLVIDESGMQSFNVQPAFGPSIQQSRWFIDSREVESARGQNELLVSRESGNYEVELIVDDVTGTIRLDAPNASRFYWKWDLEIR